MTSKLLNMTKFTSESRSAPTLPSMAAKSRENAPGNKSWSKEKKKKKKKKKRVASHIEAKTQDQDPISATNFVSQFPHAKTFTFKLSFIFIGLTHLWRYDLGN